MVSDKMMTAAVAAYVKVDKKCRPAAMRAALEAALSAAEPQPAPSVAVKALDWSGFKGVQINNQWMPDDQELIYTALGVYDGDGDMDDDAREQIIERLLAAWQRSALSAQVQDVAGAVEAFERDYPELYWHIAKGKITAGEPLYGAIITDIRGNELGDGESNVSAIDAFNIAVDDAALPAAPAKQES